MGAKHIRQYVSSHWKPAIFFAVFFAVLSAVLLWQLRSLPGGYHPLELASYLQASQIKGLLDTPLNAPFLLLIKGLSYVLPDSLAFGRLAAALIGAGVLGVFMAVLWRWHDRRTAVIGTLLFGTSAWFLHTARFGSPEVLLFGLFVLVATGFWLKRTGHWLAVLCCFLLTGILLYVPGMIWFMILGIIWQWKVLDRIFKKNVWSVTLGSTLLATICAPLGWALYKHPDLIRPLLGLPASWPTPLEMIRNVLEVPYHLFIHNAPNPALWLGIAPILDIFTIVMFILGGYLYLRKVRLVRTSLFIAILALTVGLAAIGSSVTLSIIIPFIYLVAATGISYLLELWLGVFPRNPIARAIGWIAIAIVITVTCTYHLTHYFVGWPKAAATRQVFIIKDL